MDKVVLIGGPTASGKSSLALELALKIGGVILNADSLQLYQGLEIVTAHPSKEEQTKAPHHLYGILPASDTCSVGKWLKIVLEEIKKAHLAEKVPYVVGGTGLYLKVLKEGISPIPQVDPSVRKGLLEKRDSQADLYAELKTVDASWADQIQPQDQQRTLRGLEVYYGTGKPLSYWQSHKKVKFPFTFETHLLMPSKEESDKKISARLESMLAQGLIEEVEGFQAQSPSLQAQKAIGYLEFQSYLKGDCTREEAIYLTNLRTSQFAKRQRTWFRHQFTELKK